MKFGSIVGIIVSCILILAGIITCIVGLAMAKSSDRYLFTQKNSDGTYYSQDIPDGEITKLSIDVESVTLNIFGGSDRSYIEFINYNPNYYTLNTTSKVINFDEVPDFKSMIKVWENGFSFKGLRYALDFRNYSFDDLAKEINIHLSDENTIKIIDITAVTGQIKSEDVVMSGDMIFNSSRGTITLSNTSTKSSISINGEELKASVEDVTSEVFRFTSDYAELSVTDSDSSETQVTVKDGKLDFTVADSFDEASVDLSSDSGNIHIGSELISGSYINEPESFDKIYRIKTGSAGIWINRS